jgi:hypothetical protein
MPTKPKRTCKAGSNFATALQAHGISNKEMSGIMGCHCSTITGWRYKGVPEQHAQIAADFLHVKPGCITATSKRRSKPFKDTVIARRHKEPSITPVNTITINGEAYIRVAEAEAAVRQAIDTIVDTALDAKPTFS